jgi:hypothetical protein
MTGRNRAHLLLPLALAAVLSVSACGSSSDGDRQVASLATAGSSATATAKAASGDAEKELNDYTECLRKQGVDVPDMTVDADGNISLSGAGGAGAGAGGIDQDALAEAQKVCGDPPASVTSNVQDRMNDPEFQDSALKFAQCMRKEGIDMKDPDFSQGVTGGGNGFGDLDRDDPKTAAALEICQKEFAGVTGGGN